MWFFRAIALDLDGTIAQGDRVAPEVLDALDTAHRSAALILVTGRIHEDLERTFPSLSSRFDVVVTENGAIMRVRGVRRRLAEPVDVLVEKALRDSGVSVRRGEALLAFGGGDIAVAGEAIRRLALDSQVVTNRGAAMILPAGVTKGTGLRAALEALELSVHNTVAVGDAENDLSMLQEAEVGVTVDNAVSSVRDQADLIMDVPNGSGVARLLRSPLLAGRQRLCPTRRWVPIGTYDDGSQARIPGSQSTILVTGDSGAGKSHLAGLMSERWIDAGYSVLMVDPEGDHGQLHGEVGVHIVDVHREDLNRHTALIDLMRPRGASVVLDLSRLGDEEKVAFLRSLPAAVSAHRARFGIPHWVVYDEAHLRHQSEVGTFSASMGEGATPIGTCLATWRPETLPRTTRERVDLHIHLKSSGGSGAGARRATMELQGATRWFTVGGRNSPHVRHRRKYSEVQLPPNRRFYFTEPGGRTIAEAGSLSEFARTIRTCEIRSVEHHAGRGDFSRWAADTLGDLPLSVAFAEIEDQLSQERAAAAARARVLVERVVRERYLEPKGEGAAHND